MNPWFRLHETVGLHYCSMSAKQRQYKPGGKLTEVLNQTWDRIGSAHRPLTKWIWLRK